MSKYDLGGWQERRSGRTDRRVHDQRPEQERDRSRIIHAASFRRLQGKTQVLGITESDFHRTRLTHSMEVAQISRGIVYQLQAEHASDSVMLGALPDIALIETIGFGHDLGHPPFGHGGEIALNYMMRDSGGFEGNGQSLRLLARLEPHTHGYGLDLTRRALLGILKYPATYSRLRRRVLPPLPEKLSQLSPEAWKPPKCFLDTEEEIVDWVLARLPQSDRDLFLSSYTEPSDHEHGKTKYKALDTTIMELADDIAYGIHDFEDGISLGLITRDHWGEALKVLDPTWAAKLELVPETLANDLFKPRTGNRTGTRKMAIGALVNSMVTSIQLQERSEFTSPTLRFQAVLSEPAKHFLKALTKLTREYIISLQSVQTLEYRGRFIVLSLFEALEADWQSLINIAFKRYIEETGDVKRGVCDYVAGMTDSYAVRIYERLFVPRQGSAFERL